MNQASPSARAHVAAPGSGPTRALVLAFALTLAPAAALAVRDPMRPPAAPAGRARAQGPALPQLTAILGTDARRIAIVDGRVVGVGGRVGDVLVEAVFADGIRYRRNGATHELRLAAPASIKRPAQARAAGPQEQGS